MAVLCIDRYPNGVATVETFTGLPQVIRKMWVEALVSPPPFIHTVEASVFHNPPMVEASISQHKVEASVSLTSLGVEALVSPRAMTTLPISTKKDKFNAKSRGYAP